MLETRLSEVFRIVSHTDRSVNVGFRHTFVSDAPVIKLVFRPYSSRFSRRQALAAIIFFSGCLPASSFFAESRPNRTLPATKWRDLSSAHSMYPDNEVCHAPRTALDNHLVPHQATTYLLSCEVKSRSVPRSPLPC